MRPIYNSLDIDAWLHVLLKFKQQLIHALITKRNNKVIWEVQNFLYQIKHHDNNNERRELKWTTTRKHDINMGTTVHLWHSKMSLQC